MTADHLLITLLEHFGPVVLAACLLLSWGVFQELVPNKICLPAERSFTAFFCLFGIVGTCAGIPPTSALANANAIDVMESVGRRLNQEQSSASDACPQTFRYRLKTRRALRADIAVRRKISGSNPLQEKNNLSRFGFEGGRSNN